MLPTHDREENNGLTAVAATLGVTHPNTPRMLSTQSVSPHPIKIPPMSPDPKSLIVLSQFGCKQNRERDHVARWIDTNAICHV